MFAGALLVSACGEVLCGPESDADTGAIWLTHAGFKRRVESSTFDRLRGSMGR
jgi:hypothetical protein